jgi:hypothetical protein
MRFRWKLLILLVIIAVAPIAAIRTIGVSITQRFGSQMIAQTRGHLTEQTEKRLKLLVDGYAEMLGQSRSQHEMAIMFQVKEIELALAAQAPRSSGFHPPAGTAATPAPLPDPKALSDTPGTPDAEHGNSLKVFRPASDVAARPTPGMDMDHDALRISRLFRLAPFYREISRYLGDPVLWHLVVLNDGLWSLYPSRWEVPTDFDPRNQAWFREPPNAAAFWSTSIRTPSAARKSSQSRRRSTARTARSPEWRPWEFPSAACSSTRCCGDTPLPAPNA